MGYPVKTVNLNIKGCAFRSNDSKELSIIGTVEHDWRQYGENGKTFPGHIRQDDIGKNTLLYICPSLKKDLDIDADFYVDSYSYENYLSTIQNADLTYKGLLKIFNSEKARREKLESKFKWIASQAPHFCSFIVNFSKKAQKEIVDENIPLISSMTKDFVLDFFEKIMGVKLIYLVGHFDESAPHFHGVVTNQRYYDNYTCRKPEDLYNNPYFSYLAEKYHITDLKEKIANGFCRTFTGTFTSNKEFLNQSPYRLPFSFLQDITHLAFRDIGFERGKSKEERLAEGEPLWKLISRDVKTLHEDLPREIELKRAEIENLVNVIVTLQKDVEGIKEEIFTAREEKEGIEREIEELKTQLNMKISELKMVESNKKKAEEEYEELLMRIRRLAEEEGRYSEDELLLLSLVKKLIETDSLIEIARIEKMLKGNRLIAFIETASNYIDALRSKTDRNQADILRKQCQNFLDEKGVAPEIMEEDVEQEVTEEETLRIKKKEEEENQIEKIDTL